MLINVPQYIDVEDKIVGPLTAKQLGYFVGLGVALLVLWNVVPLALFIIIAIPMVLFVVALSFYRPYGQPLGSFLLFGVFYFFRPKIYVWKRTAQPTINIPKKVQTTSSYIPEKKLTTQSLSDLARMLDSEGVEHAKGIEDILKKQEIKK